MKNKIIELLKNEYTIDSNIENRLDQFLECINSEDVNVDKVMEWLQNIKDNLPATVTEINLNEVNDGWNLNSETGTLEHETGGFFKVIGVRTETDIRESGKGWNQPIFCQWLCSPISTI